MKVDPTHKTRFSDSSLYDEVCIYCGATDGRGDNRLGDPCPNRASPKKDKQDRNK
jgi:hypothetical protein